MSQGDLSEDMTSRHAQSPSLDVIFRDSLFPAIRNGSVESVRAILNCTSDSGSLVNLLCPASGKSALFVAVECGHYEICEELLKHGADAQWVYASEEAIARRLVLGVFAEEVKRASCLDIAVRDGRVQIVDLLIRFGAGVNRMTWTFWLAKCRPQLNPLSQRTAARLKMFRTLLSVEGHAVPIYEACEYLVTAKLENEFDGISSQLQRVDWIYNCYAVEGIVGYFQRIPKVRSRLLEFPTHGEVEQFYKSLLLQSLYVRACYHPPDPIWMEESLLSMVLQKGVAVDGWTVAHTKAMQRAWLNGNHAADGIQGHVSEPTFQPFVNRYSMFWSLFSPRLSVVCERCATTVAILQSKDSQETVSSSDAESRDVHRSRFRDDSITSFHPACYSPAILYFLGRGSGVMEEVLLSCSKLSWLSDQTKIPMSVFHLIDVHVTQILALHNGPTCGDHTNLSAKQKKVSLKMCTCSGGTVQSLMSMCRDVITNSCLEYSENVFDAVESLPLPTLLKCYMLSN